MRLIVVGGAGGSGGYVRYLRGILGSGVTPPGWDVLFVATPQFIQQLQPLDPTIRCEAAVPLGTGPRLRRALWYFADYPVLVRRFRPTVEFFPSGQLRVYGRRAVTVATCHNLLLFSPKEIERYPHARRASLRRWREQQRRSFAAANGLIFQSEFARRVVLNEAGTSARTQVIPHGLDAPLLRTEERDYAIGPTVTLLSVSSIHPYKNHETVVRAVGHMCRQSGWNIRLRIVGGGEQSEVSRLRTIVTEEGLDHCVTLVGELPYELLVGEYVAADIFIFASSCETFGISLLEAMGQALPIACSRETGLPQLLQSGGVYFDPKDPQSIVRTLHELLSSEEARRRVATAARRLAQGYTWARSADLTYSFVESVGTRMDGR